MAYQGEYEGVVAGMGGMNIQDQPLPSAPPPSAPPPSALPIAAMPPTEAPPPYNPSVEQKRPLQQQTSLPAFNPQQQPPSSRSHSYAQLPPYYQNSLPRPQSGHWAQNYPDSPPQGYMSMSLPRQMPPGQSRGAPGYPQGGAWSQPQPLYGPAGQPGYGGVAYRPPAPPVAVQYVSPCKPTGYNIMELFRTGNQLYLLPETSSNRAPIRTDWGKVVGNGSFANEDTVFVVEEPRGSLVGDHVIALRNLANHSRYIAMTARSDIKARSGFNLKCEWRVRPVGSVEGSVVCLESVSQPGKFMGILPNGSTINASTLVPTSKEAQFRVRAHRISCVRPVNLPLKAYGRLSVLNQLADRCTVTLCNKTSKLFLGIDVKGRVKELKNGDDPHALFMLFDRGMGVVSLRSWKHPGYWLRVVNGVLLGKGVPAWLEADFNIKESYDSSVCFEPFTSPGTLTTPPDSACYDFTLKCVTVTQ